MPPTAFLLAGLGSVREQREKASYEKKLVSLLFTKLVLHIDEYSTCSVSSSTDQQLQSTRLAWQDILESSRRTSFSHSKIIHWQYKFIPLLTLMNDGTWLVM